MGKDTTVKTLWVSETLVCSCEKCGSVEFALDKDKYSETIYVYCRNCSEEVGVLCPTKPS
jgi:carbonic anhydrase